MTIKRAKLEVAHLDLAHNPLVVIGVADYLREVDSDGETLDFASSYVRYTTLYAKEFAFIAQNEALFEGEEEEGKYPTEDMYVDFIDKVVDPSRITMEVANLGEQVVDHHSGDLGDEHLEALREATLALMEAPFNGIDEEH